MKNFIVLAFLSFILYSCSAVNVTTYDLDNMPSVQDQAALDEAWTSLGSTLLFEDNRLKLMLAYFLGHSKLSFEPSQEFKNTYDQFLYHKASMEVKLFHNDIKGAKGSMNKAIEALHKAAELLYEQATLESLPGVGL